MKNITQALLSVIFMSFSGFCSSSETPYGNYSTKNYALEQCLDGCELRFALNKNFNQYQVCVDRCQRRNAK